MPNVTLKLAGISDACGEQLNKNNYWGSGTPTMIATSRMLLK